MQNNANTSVNLSTDDIERLARKRAGAKMGWYIHALVYIAVNIGLALLAGMHGRNWAIFPALGWGLGLLIHGLVVFATLPGGSLRERLVARERSVLLNKKDVW
jgi:hypothetical protein